MKKIEKITCYMPYKINFLMASTKVNTNNTITPTVTGTKTFSCPVDHCGQRIHENPRQIAGHIRKSHPKIAKSMGLDVNPGKLAFICKPCDSFTTTVHHHCFECEHPENGGKSRHFKTAAERDEHLKRDHAKWWYEYECKFGLDCRGKKGGCGFNHNHFDEPYLTDTEAIPSCVCRYDRPWEGVRCYRDKCSFSHFWGRVRFLIKTRAESEASTPASTTAPVDVNNIVETCNDCTDCSDTVVAEEA